MKAIYSTFSRKQITILMGLLLFLLCYNSQSFAQGKNLLSKSSGFNSWTPSFLLPYSAITDNPGPDSVVRTDFTIQMRDGVIIDALKYVPVRNSVPEGGYFTVIMVHGYGDNKNTLATFAHDQATYGYYVMTFSVRGQGLSGGVSNLISNVERDDLLEIIQWVKNDSINGSNPGKILVMGGSQGGLLPFKAACAGANVAAIISSVAPPNFASNWIENGCVKTTCLWTMDYTPDTARYSQQVINMRNWILGDTKAGFDSVARLLPQGRDFVTELPNCTVPIMIEASWQDKFFNASGWLNNIQNVSAPMTSYIGAVRGHGGDVSTTEDTWHMQWFNDWYFQWLWNMNTGILNAPKYQYASTVAPVVGTNWSFVHNSSTTLLKNNSTNTRLYFNSNSKLKTTAQTGGFLPAMEFLVNDVRNNYTLQQAINDDFHGTNFNNKFKIDDSKFETTALTADMEMTGTPTMKIDYIALSKPYCQFNFQIFEVFPNGTSRFVTRLNYMDRNNNFNFLPSRKQATFQGDAHSHIFKAGSKIRIVLTNFDRPAEEVPFFTNSPFVLPCMNPGIYDMLLTNNFYIDLPVVSHTGSRTTNYFAEEDNSVKNNEPYSFSLSQNYPNPFNPSTVIKYTVSKADNVELKVYDILGKEVATLVNQVQNPGSYSVMFNAANLASGAYFYRIKTGSFTEIKKMMLVK